MKRALLALGLSLIMSPVAFGANTVSWAAGNPIAGTWQVTGSGTYTVDPGWTAVSCSMIAIPTAGGMGYNVSAPLTVANKWGPLVIKGLPAGQYNVTASVSFKQAGNNPVVIYSPVSIVNVLGGGGG